MGDFPCPNFAFCGRYFASRWAAQHHERACAYLLRRTQEAAREREQRRGPSSGWAPKNIRSIATRRIVANCPELRSQAEATGLVVSEERAPSNARDNVILRPTEGGRGCGAHPVGCADPDCPNDCSGTVLQSMPVSVLQNECLDAEDPGGIRRSSSEGVDIFNFDHVTEKEISEAARELALRISERSGAKLMNRFLRLVLSDKWSAAGRRWVGEGGKSLLTVEDLRKDALESDSFRSDMARSGFQRRLVVNPSCASSVLEMYMRDPTEVVTRQLRMARESRDNIHFHPIEQQNRAGERVVGHPMSAAVAWKSLPKVREAVMENACEDVVWDSSESFVAMLQCYSDKSCMSLKSSSLTFYPFHVTVMNFTSAATEQFIRSGDTIVAYLPVSSGWPEPREGHLDRAFTKSGEPLSSFLQPCEEDDPRDACDEHRDGRPGQRDFLRPVESREIFIQSLRLCLAPLRDAAVRGIRFQDGDGKWRKAHLVVASYTGDTPEIVCLTCIFSGFCPRCEISKEKMSEASTIGNRREASVTNKLLQRYRDEHLGAGNRNDMGCGAREDPASRVMKDVGLTSSMPYFGDWPFSDVDRRLDCYRIARFDFLHTFPLGLQKQLVTLLSDRLKSKTLKSSAYLTKDGRPKALATVRGKILSALNAYLKEIERDYPAVALHVDFSQGKPSSARDGLFCDAGIAPMLEAKDLNNVMQVLPQVAALADRLCCGDPVVARVFVKYVTLVRTVCRRGSDEKAFSAADLADIENMIVDFKTCTIDVFREFQSSGFRFPKWHALEHLVHDIRDLGNCANFSTAPFEASHLLFKEKHRSTSRRKGAALQETARRIELAEALREARDYGDSRHNQVMSWLVDGKKATRKSDEIGERTTGSASRPRDLSAQTDGGTPPQMTPTKPTSIRQTRHATSLPSFAPRTSKEEAIAIDACVLARVRDRRLSFSFIELASAIARIAGDSNGSRKRCFETAMDLSSENLFVASVGGYTMAKKAADILIQKHSALFNCGDGSQDASQVNRMRAAQFMKICVVKSAHVAGFRTPSLEDQSGSQVFVTDDGYRVLQKVRSALTYSHRGEPLQETVLVEAQRGRTHCSPELRDDSQDGRHVMGEQLEFWFAKVLAFIAVSDARGRGSAKNWRVQCEENDSSEEMAVVRYYDIVDEVELDDMDRALQCIKLKWSVHQPSVSCDGVHKNVRVTQVAKEPWIDVIPVSSIRGRVHVVPVPDVASIVRCSDNSSSDDDDESDCGERLPGSVVFSGSNNWRRRRFYANVYRDDPNDVAYNLVDIGKGKDEAHAPRGGVSITHRRET